jgi:hypothetical protein
MYLSLLNIILKIKCIKKWLELLILFNYLEKHLASQQINLITLDCMYQVFSSKTLFPYIIFHFFISSFDDTSFISFYYGYISN